jgi:hypothetical protein
LEKIVDKKRLSYPESYTMLLELSRQENISFERAGKNTFLLSKDNEESLFFKLPPLFPEPEICEPLPDYIRKVPETPPPYILYLVQAGAAALGYFEKGEAVKHKTLNKYMVRKKQGKSQLTYLRQKGKSRAGSRIRLKESLEFFEEINHKLIDWKEHINKAAFIFYSCPIRLTNELYLARTPPPFERNDKRLRKIPFHVKTPNHKELMHINYLINSGYLLSETANK